MTSSIGKYASSYEEAVFKGHPDKVVRSDVRPADYISSSRLGSFWATRAEELLILLFLALVIGYCTGFYVVDRAAPGEAGDELWLGSAPRQCDAAPTARPPLRAAPAREKGGRSHAGRGAGGGQGEAEGGGARLLLEAQRRAPRVRARRRGPLALRLGGRPLLLGRVFLMACARAGECVVMRGSPSRAVRGVL
mmetsp:Transcript_30519/g.91133  ORF Transcript_30519/g.91133 Transcript_30519/m.91133 type:complete len:193 (+) Transcript_30519:86-664(+)